ncbi:WecB/TagA/CpsF family glycosyltransferase [Methylosinus sp. Sm6]|uniref:WecB/TagA/CpsF family glycosyltransferase n=1 Tax=Methylosinus sp. Sm6 TaxID=2866948 RepID=UPI001C991F63|nr:WecB/TagA/CpsF family glycosyltransferase [Methylosinus sp. Sm6]MBY6241985.1 WecB/TagA/CpsF family glycosyltransferase [Methylosinus sp. Sm6]
MKRALNLGPIRIEHLTVEEALRRIEDALEGRGSRRVAFCNAHTASNAFFDPVFRHALAQMLVFNDGVALDIASRLVTGAAFPGNLNGTDLVPTFLATSKRPLRIYLLGARPDVVARAAARLAESYPWHEVVGYRDGYFSAAEEAAVVAEIASHAPDVLLVAMGNPRQELFMDAHRDELNSRLTFGVGALFDFVSGTVPRAPAWLRRARLEWLFRLWREPRRLVHRYTVGAFTFALAMACFRLQGVQQAQWPWGNLSEPRKLAYGYTFGAFTFALAIVFLHLHKVINSP